MAAVGGLQADLRNTGGLLLVAVAVGPLEINITEDKHVNRAAALASCQDENARRDGQEVQSGILLREIVGWG